MSALRAGLCSVTFRDLRVSDVLELARRAGIGAIEWGADRHVPIGDRDTAQRVREESARLGIAAVSYGSYVRAGVDGIDTFAVALATARALGAVNVRVWAGRRGVSSRDVPESALQRCAEDLRGFAVLAQAGGIAVSLEFHPATLSDTLESTIALLERVGHANLYTYWQPRPGVGLDEAMTELTALRPWLTHVHAYNWNAQRLRFPLRDAAPFWRPLIERLSQFDTPLLKTRRIMLEFVAGNAPDAFLDDASTLNEWLSTVGARAH